MKWLQEKATAYTALTITQQVASTSAVLLLTNSQWPQVNYLNQWGGTEESGRKAEAENRKEQISRSGGGLSCVILSFLWARECSWKAPLSELKPLLSSLCFSFRQKLNSSAAEGRGLWSAFFFFFSLSCVILIWEKTTEGVKTPLWTWLPCHYLCHWLNCECSVLLF